MRLGFQILNTVVAALLALVFTSAMMLAQGVDDLLDQLAKPDTQGWRRLERQILTEWSKSGSPAMDLLLARGRDALAATEYDAAIEHFTALVDHAPDFAEGYNGRATAYFRAGLFGPALDDLAQVLRLNPRHFRALAGLATLLAETNQKARALDAYRAALAIHPHLEDVRKAVKSLETELNGQSI